MKQYTINSKVVPRRVFFQCLKEDCQSNQTIPISDDFVADVQVLVEKDYRRHLRNLRNGHMLLFMDSGHTYSSIEVRERKI